MLNLLFIFDHTQEQSFVETLQQDLQSHHSSIKITNLDLINGNSNYKILLKEADSLILVINQKLLHYITEFKLVYQAVKSGKKLISMIPEEIVSSRSVPNYLLKHPYIIFEKKHDLTDISQQLAKAIYSDSKASNNQFFDVFISYGRPYSTEFCRKLEKELQRQGFQAWLDLHDIPPGVDWQEQINQGILKSHVFIFVISPKSIISENCRWEIDLAIKNNKRFIPLLHIEENDLGNINQFLAKNFPENHPIRRIQWIDFREGKTNFKQALKKLIHTFKVDWNYVRNHTRLLERGQEWIQHHRHSDYLLVGKDLAKAREWLGNCQEPSPSHLHFEYISASDKKQAERIIHRLFITIFILGGSIITLLLYLFFVSAKKEQMFALLKVAESPYSSQRLDGLVASLEAGKSLKYPLGYLAQFYPDIQSKIGQKLIYGLITPASKFQSDVSTALQRSIYWNEEKNQLFGHKLPVLSVSFSPDGKLIASASRDGQIKVWTQYGRLLQTLEGHQDTVYHVGFSLDSQMIVSSSKDGSIKLWKSRNLLYPNDNDQSGDPQFFFYKTLDHQPYWEVNRLEFSLNGQLIVSASEPINKQSNNNPIVSEIRLWNLDGNLIETIPGKSKVTSLSFSPDKTGKITLAAATQDGYLQLFTLDDGQLIETLKPIKISENNDNKHLTYLSFSPDGKFLVGASNEGTLLLFKSDGTFLSSPLEEQHTRRINALQFSPKNPDGKVILATASQDETAKLWQLDSKQSQLKLIKTLEGHLDNVWRIQFSPHGYFLATASYDNTIKLWQRDGTLLKTFEGHQDLVNSLSFSPNNKTLASASYDHSIKLWRLEKQSVAVLPHKRPAISVSFATLNHLLITTPIIEQKENDTLFKLGMWQKSHSLDNTWQLKSLSDAEDLSVEEAHIRPILSTDISNPILIHGGWKQLNASGSEDGFIKLWDETGKLLDTASPKPSGKVLAVSFSPDGQKLVCTTENTQIQMWDVQHGKLQPLTTIPKGLGETRFGRRIPSQGHEGRIFDVEFTPDNQLLASAGEDGNIKFWQADGTFRKTLKTHQGSVFSLDFSRNGKGLLLASGGENKTVKLWKQDETGNFKLWKELKDHQGSILDVRFSPDGKLIASASDDYTVKLWTRDGQLLLTLKKHRLPVKQVSFSPDGRWLASASHDNDVIVWQLPQLFNSTSKQLRSSQIQEQLLDELIEKGCDSAQDYLRVKAEEKHNKNGVETKKYQEISEFCVEVNRTKSKS